MESRSQRRRRRLAKSRVLRPKQNLSQRARTILFRLVAFHALAAIGLGACMLMFSKSGGMAISDGLLDLPILVSVFLTVLVFLLFPIVEIAVLTRGIRSSNEKVSISNFHVNHA